MKGTISVVGTTAPLLVDWLGVKVPAMSMLMGLMAVILVRVMLMSKDFVNDKTFWYYNISLTLLMVVIAFAIIADQQLGPGLAVMVGTGIGASGMVVVDILKERIQNVVRAMFGQSSNQGDK